MRLKSWFRSRTPIPIELPLIDQVVSVGTSSSVFAYSSIPGAVADCARHVGPPTNRCELILGLEIFPMQTLLDLASNSERENRRKKGVNIVEFFTLEICIFSPREFAISICLGSSSKP